MEAHEHSFGGDWQAEETGRWQVCTTCGAVSAATQSSTASSVPQTGDASTPGLWIVLMVAGGMDAAGASLQKRKGAKR